MFFGMKRKKWKKQPIDAPLEATQEAAHYDPDAYLTVSGFGLPLLAFSFEKEVEDRARKYVHEVNGDEHNGDYMDTFLTARADQLRRSLDLQLARKTFTIQERARGQAARVLRAQEALAQAQRELARCQAELAHLRQLDDSPF